MIRRHRRYHSSNCPASDPARCAADASAAEEDRVRGAFPRPKAQKKNPDGSIDQADFLIGHSELTLVPKRAATSSILRASSSGVKMNFSNKMMISAPKASMPRRFFSVLIILWKSSTSARAWHRKQKETAKFLGADELVDVGTRHRHFAAATNPLKEVEGHHRCADPCK